MKPGTLTGKRVLLPVLAAGMAVALVSWDFKQSGTNQQQEPASPTDTIPKKKKAEKKVRDLDDVLDELNAVDFDREMGRAKEEMEKALKEIDYQKIQLDVQKAMQEVDMVKIKEEIAKAMKEIDFEKIKQEVQESVAKIDFEKIKKEIEEVQKQDFTKIKVEMDKVQEEMKKIGPQIQKEMEKVKIDLEKAKEEIEKAKAEIKEYKEFVDQLDKDGLINKKDNYSIGHEDGELTINGKKVSEKEYAKYRSFLEKHKKFSIRKTADDFDFDKDDKD